MSDRTCIICREEMVAATNNQNTPGNAEAANDATNAGNTQEGPNVTPKKLPCGHIFHFQCLRSWLERQQSCPTWLVLTSTHLIFAHPTPKNLADWENHPAAALSSKQISQFEALPKPREALVRLCPSRMLLHNQRSKVNLASHPQMVLWVG